jgi:hypothetical protein
MLPVIDPITKYESDRRKRRLIQMGVLTFENIMEANDITVTNLPVPEWGGEVVVKSISHRKMREIKKNLATNDDGEVDNDEV